MQLLRVETLLLNDCGYGEQLFTQILVMCKLCKMISDYRIPFLLWHLVTFDVIFVGACMIALRLCDRLALLR